MPGGLAPPVFQRQRQLLGRLDAVAAAALGLIERGIGRRQQHLELGARRPAGDADADGGIDRAVVDRRFRKSRTPRAPVRPPSRPLPANTAATPRTPRRRFAPTGPMIRSVLTTTVANSLRISSPAGWPKRSLIDLKWSMSKISTVTGRPALASRSITRDAGLGKAAAIEHAGQGIDRRRGLVRGHRALGHQHEDDEHGADRIEHELDGEYGHPDAAGELAVVRMQQVAEQDRQHQHEAVHDRHHDRPASASAGSGGARTTIRWRSAPHRSRRCRRRSSGAARRPRAPAS